MEEATQAVEASVNVYVSPVTTSPVAATAKVVSKVVIVIVVVSPPTATMPTTPTGTPTQAMPTIPSPTVMEVTTPAVEIVTPVPPRTINRYERDVYVWSINVRIPVPKVRTVSRVPV